MTKQDKAFLAGVMTMEAASIQLQKELIEALKLAWPFVDVGPETERRRAARVTVAAALAKAGA